MGGDGGVGGLGAETADRDGGAEAEVAEQEVRNSMVETLEEREVVVIQEMMRRWFSGLVEVVLVGLKAQSFWALREEVEERVQAAAKEVPLVLEMEH